MTPSTTAITTDIAMSLNEKPVFVLDDDIQDLSCKLDTNKNINAVVRVSITIDLKIESSSKAAVSVANTGELCLCLLHVISAQGLMGQLFLRDEKVLD